MSKKDSIDYFSDDKQKQLLAIMNKMMSMNMNNNISFDNNSKTKKLEELKEKVEKYEEENKNLYNQFIDKENIYIDKIKTLERKMLTSEKADAIFLQKQNKEYELTINNLNRNIRKISSENESESIRFKSMIGELMMLKDQLAEEISENGTIKWTNKCCKCYKTTSEIK
jgi:predicted RNase H-like nuclease (RuvC/YqgF family)